MTDKTTTSGGTPENAPQRRERDTATFTPYYWEAYNEIVQPRRFDHYLITKWLPELGAVGFSLIKTLRDRCYHNRETGVLRDSCEINLNELAVSIGVSLSTLQRTMRENEALKMFIRRVRQYKMVDGRPRQEANRYQVSMDDPIHPDDYERYDELRAQKESDRDQTLPGTYIKGKDGQPVNPLFQALLNTPSLPANTSATTLPATPAAYDGQIDHHREKANKWQTELSYDGQFDHHRETLFPESVKRFNSQGENLEISNPLSKPYDGQFDHHRASYDGQIDLADTTCLDGQFDLAETTSLGGQFDHHIKEVLPFGDLITKGFKNTPEAGGQIPPINPPRGRGEEEGRGPGSGVGGIRGPGGGGESAAYDGHGSAAPTLDPRTPAPDSRLARTPDPGSRIPPTPDPAAYLWPAVLAVLAAQVQSGEINLPTWHGHLTRLRLESIAAGEGRVEAVIAAPSSFTRDWVEKRHADRLRAAIATVLSRPAAMVNLTIIGPEKSPEEGKAG